MRNEEEEIRTPPDHKGSPLPLGGPMRESGRTSPRRPAIWSLRDTVALAPEPVFGAYPKGFLHWALRQLRCAPSEVLHVCAGMLGRTAGVSVDVRPAARPSICADGRVLPFRDSHFGGVLLDPPYSVEYAEGLYGCEYPRPSHLLAESARVARPGAILGMLHFLVPQLPPDCRLLSVHGVTTGLGYRIRAFTLYQKHQRRLFT